jgi:hypothetical protein
MGERGDHGFEVAPTRIGGSDGPGRSGRRRLTPIILVVILAVAIPTVAWVGPHIEWRPEVDLSFLRPTPTPVPTPTPRPTQPPTPAPATPLPAITIGVGPHPTEPFPVDVAGVRLADPMTGSLGPPLGLRVDNDMIFTSPDGAGWWCVCFAHGPPGADHETVAVEIRHVDRTGQVSLRRTVGEFRSTAPPPAQDFYNRFDIVVSPDKRTAYLSSGTRTGDTWSVALDAIDFATGKVTAHSDVGTYVIPPLTGPSMPPDQGTVENYLNGPSMRISTDGRQILLWASIETYVTSTGEAQAAIPQGWRIEVDPGLASGSIGRVTSLDRSFVERLRGCNSVAWTNAREIAAVCWPMTALTSNVTLVLFDPDGAELGHVDLLGVIDSWITDPVLDRANRVVYLWQPGGHVLSRVDLDSRSIDQVNVDPAATGGGPSSRPSDGPGSGLAPEWATLGSDLHLYYRPQLVPEPGTNRLFALGVLEQRTTEQFGYGSSGIWVFDGAELSLLDHWEALAAYGSIGLSSDGRWLLAAGEQGVDAEGRQASWESSITVLDTSDGRPALQLGRLGFEVQVLQIPP